MPEDAARKRIMFAWPATLGLLLAAAFFYAALMPSLIPRSYAVQGALGGLAAAVGYMIGAGLTGIWRFMGLPLPEGRAERGVRRTGAAVAVVIAALGLAQVTGWQNAVRTAVEMPPVETVFPLSITVIALVVFAILFLLGRAFRLVARKVSLWLQRFLPPRVAVTLSLIAAAALFWSVGSGVIFENALAALDRTYARVDRLVRPEQPQPTDPLKSGSAASLTTWDGLGNEGRNMVVVGPTAADIQAFTSRPAKEPLRVYVGLNSADSPAERADLALAELQRIGAFDRAVLQIATPTGTGWIDPAAQMPIEYLTGGDIATVAVQYSYLPSWLTLFVDRDGYGTETARAVFQRVYGHWRSLPEASRPKLYLSGLSLGSVNGQAALDLYDVIAAPFDGALWVGPPFANRTWRDLTAARNPDTPIWLPTFRDSSVVRFTAQKNALDVPNATWGPMRIVYLQYAGDPIVFFTTDSALSEPEFLKGERGPDVSPAVSWFPVVTFLQLAFDMMIATSTPVGHGHVYAARNYTEGWAEVLDRQDWTPAEVDRLKTHLTEMGL